MTGTTSADARDRFNRKRKSLLKLAQSFYSIGDRDTGDIVFLRLVNLHREGIAIKAKEVMNTLRKGDKSCH